MTGIVSAVRSPNDLVLRSSRLKSAQTAAVCTLTATAVCRPQEQRVAGMSVAGPFSLESVYHQVISPFTVLVEFVAWYCVVVTVSAALKSVPPTSSAQPVFDMLIVVGALWMWETVRDKECAQRDLLTVHQMAQHTQPVIFSTYKRWLQQVIHL